MSALPPLRAHPPRLLQSWPGPARDTHAARQGRRPEQRSPLPRPPGRVCTPSGLRGPDICQVRGGGRVSEQLNWTHLVCVLKTINGVQLKGIQFKSIWQKFIECPLQVRL